MKNGPSDQEGPFTFVTINSKLKHVLESQGGAFLQVLRKLILKLPKDI